MKRNHESLSPDLRRRRIAAAMVAAPSMAFGLGTAKAQSKRLTIVLTVPPGTASDTLARLLGEHLRARLDRTVVVESKPGGGGIVAIQHMRQFDADGSHIVLAPSSGISLLPLFTSKPAFDYERDLVAVCDAAAAPHTITVNSASGISTFGQYIEFVRKNPKQGSIGTPSPAGLASLMVYQIRKSLNVDVQHVPYKGGAPLLGDLLGGQIPASASVLPDYLADHRAGKLRILAHASEKRTELAPSIPTFVELGYPALVAVTSFGVFAKAGTEPAIVQEYNAAINEGLALPRIMERLNQLGLDPLGGSALEYSRKLSLERTRWAPLIKETGMTVDGT